MKILFIFSAFFLLALTVFGQKDKSIELSLLARHDLHAEYISNFSDRVYNDTLKLSGTSYGFNIGMTKKLKGNLSGYFGIGYYRLTIDKIRGSNRLNPSEPSNYRHTDYRPDSTLPLYSTKQYHYNNIAFTLGLHNNFFIKEKLNANIGIEGIAYHSFSQVYMIHDDKYVTKNKKPLELGLNLSLGITKEFKDFYIKPVILVPIYQNLKGDKVFREDVKMDVLNWFSGLGIKISIGKYL